MLRSNFISASQTKHITRQTKHNITWDSSGGEKASYYLMLFSIACPSSSRWCSVLSGLANSFQASSGKSLFFFLLISLSFFFYILLISSFLSVSSANQNGNIMFLKYKTLFSVSAAPM